MRVLVTGATGLVGSHAAATLAAAGHRVRALVRDADKLTAALAPFGTDAEAVVGDMTDADAVARAAAGCDAVVHTAAVIGVAGSGTGGTDVNLVGTRNVVEAGLAAGADPIIYTSSLAAYFPTEDPPITAGSPLVDPLSDYGASKRDVELLVRRHQAAGAPVTTLVLGSVYGAPSPHPADSYPAVMAALQAGFMVVPPGGMGVIDVRDVATLILRCLEPGRGPRRYVAGGRYLSWAEWTEALSRAAGVPIAAQSLSRDEILELGRQFDAVRAGGGEDPGALSEEAALIMVTGVPTDDTATLAELGVAYRPVSETFADTVAHLRSAELLPAAGS